jgi:flagellin
MTVGINTNIPSMTAQRNLNANQNTLQSAITRLSSGLRINSAKDDAAGLAIVTRMSTQIGGLNQAVRNANDGVSIAQTAEGALEEMSKNLNRAHDLAVQAASYNTTGDRVALNQETTLILAEMSRIVTQTRYNGDQILSGGFNASIQVGAKVGETIDLQIGNLSPTTMGVATDYSTVSALSAAQLASRIAVSYNNAMTSSTVEGVSVANAAAQTNSATKITNLNAVTAQTGVSGFGYGNGNVGATYASVAATANVTDGITAGALTVNGVAIGGATGGASASDTATNLAAAINAVTSQTGVTASIVSNPTGALATSSAIVLTNTTGAAISVTSNTSIDAGISTFFTAGNTSTGAGQNGAIVLNDTRGDLTLSYDSSTTGAALAGVSVSTTTLTDATLGSQILTSAASANLAMLVFESALDTINSERSNLGATINRFDSVTRNLANVSENISAARGRIQDADFAEETAKLTKAQILQQAATAMISQANQLPQGVLTLLR